MKSAKSIRLFLLISFLVLAVLAHFISYFRIDLILSRSVQNIHQPYFSNVMNIVSEIGDDYHFGILVGITSLILIIFKLSTEAFTLVGSILSGALLGSFFKTLVQRPRPSANLVKIQEVFHDKSFPSLHVVLFTVFFGYLFFLSSSKLKNSWLKKIIMLISIFLVLSISLSRVYLGVHWPSDTLGGYLLGLYILSFIVHYER